MSVYSTIDPHSKPDSGRDQYEVGIRYRTPAEANARCHPRCSAGNGFQMALRAGPAKVDLPEEASEQTSANEEKNRTVGRASDARKCQLRLRQNLGHIGKLGTQHSPGNDYCYLEAPYVAIISWTRVGQILKSVQHK